MSNWENQVTLSESHRGASASQSIPRTNDILRNPWRKPTLWLKDECLVLDAVSADPHTCKWTNKDEKDQAGGCHRSMRQHDASASKNLAENAARCFEPNGPLETGQTPNKVMSQ